MSQSGAVGILIGMHAFQPHKDATLCLFWPRALVAASLHLGTLSQSCGLREIGDTSRVLATHVSPCHTRLCLDLLYSQPHVICRVSPPADNRLSNAKLHHRLHSYHCFCTTMRLLERISNDDFRVVKTSLVAFQHMPSYPTSGVPKR